VNEGPSAEVSDKDHIAPQHRDYPVKVFNDIRCSLGEGPAWDESSRSLFWVDIQGRKIYSATVDGVVTNTWSTVAPPSAVILSHSGKKLVPAGQQVLELCSESGEIMLNVQLSGEPSGNRCNDAKCDPLGNLWIGTMDNSEKERVGRLWRIDSSGEGTVFLDSIGVANTLAWDMQRGRFYFADSMVGDIYVFDYDRKRAEIGCRNIFFHRDGAPGVPDGSAIDEEGYLWNARWDGGCVVRISPDGDLDRVVELPVQRPTSCAFGGENMKTLYITSAASGSSAPPDRADLSGAVFSIEVDVAGSRVPAYEGPVG
jgi:sugar lactone lactonase YvrE